MSKEIYINLCGFLVGLLIMVIPALLRYAYVCVKHHLFWHKELGILPWHSRDKVRELIKKDIDKSVERVREEFEESKRGRAI